MPRAGDPHIAIVDIDEESLRKEGRWPWRRDRLGLLLDHLFDKYHVRVVGFDVIFAEEDTSSGLPVLRALAGNELAGVPRFQQALRSIEPKLEFDRIFADSMRDRQVVLAGFTSVGRKVRGLTKGGHAVRCEHCQRKRSTGTTWR